MRTKPLPARLSRYATGLHVLVLYTIVWYAVNMVKKQTSIRMSYAAKELVVLLAERLGISQSAVLELAIRTLAKREGIQEKGVK